MADVEVLSSLAYVVFAALVVSPPTEFVAAGLTVQGALGGLLGSEQLSFVDYHLRRTTATMLLHATLPLGQYATMPLDEYATLCLDQYAALPLSQYIKLPLINTLPRPLINTLPCLMISTVRYLYLDQYATPAPR